MSNQEPDDIYEPERIRFNIGVECVNCGGTNTFIIGKKFKTERSIPFDFTLAACEDCESGFRNKEVSDTVLEIMESYN